MVHPDQQHPGYARLYVRGALPGSSGLTEPSAPTRRLELLGGDAVRCLLAQIPLGRLKAGR